MERTVLDREKVVFLGDGKVIISTVEDDFGNVGALFHVPKSGESFTVGAECDLKEEEMTSVFAVVSSKKESLDVLIRALQVAKDKL